MSAGRMFGKYELVEQLGRGGMAEVWRAKIRGAAGFERSVVVKRILPHLARDEEFTAMFVREAQLCSMLSHANIVQVFELGEIDGEYYLAMEHVRGRDLHKIVRARPKAPPPPGLVALAGRDVCRALAYADQVKDDEGRTLHVIHRDVTPSNVMVSFDGTVKLVDFGVAKAMTSAALTASGTIKGKLSYMAPEQVQGAELDHRTDLFAVGIVTHEVLTGRRLFKGDSEEDTVDRILNLPIIPPSHINPEVPKTLDAVVLRALERDPQKRFQTGEELADAFAQVVHELKWGPAQMSALLRERFPNEAQHAVSAAQAQGARRSLTQTGIPAIDQANVDPLDPLLEATRTIAGPARPTARFVRAVDEMGAWTHSPSTPTETEYVDPIDALPRRRGPLRFVLAGSALLCVAAAAMFLRAIPGTEGSKPPAVAAPAVVTPTTAPKEKLPAPTPPPSTEAAPSAVAPAVAPRPPARLVVEAHPPSKRLRASTHGKLSARPVEKAATPPRKKHDVERGDVVDPF